MQRAVLSRTLGERFQLWMFMPNSRPRRYAFRMRKVVCLLLASLLLAATPVVADDAAAEGNCFSRKAQRREISAGHVVSPGKISRSISGDVLKMRLCRTAGGPVWQATALQRNGRVVGYVFDGRTGRRIR